MFKIEWKNMASFAMYTKKMPLHKRQFKLGALARPQKAITFYLKTTVPMKRSKMNDILQLINTKTIKVVICREKQKRVALVAILIRLIQLSIEQ